MVVFFLFFRVSSVVEAELTTVLEGQQEVVAVELSLLLERNHEVASVEAWKKPSSPYPYHFRSNSLLSRLWHSQYPKYPSSVAGEVVFPHSNFSRRGW